jgi:hypothetical protein
MGGRAGQSANQSSDPKSGLTCASRRAIFRARLAPEVAGKVTACVPDSDLGAHSTQRKLLWTQRIARMSAHHRHRSWRSPRIRQMASYVPDKRRKAPSHVAMARENSRERWVGAKGRAGGSARKARAETPGLTLASRLLRRFMACPNNLPGRERC